MAGLARTERRALTRDAVVRVERVGHRYGAVAALGEVSLELPAGASLGVIGPDGVGKSTLLGLVAGARRIQTGRVAVLGGDMADAPHRRRVCSRIAYMPQGLGRNLYPDLTVAENVDFFARLFGQAGRERAGELMRATGLAPFAARLAKQLSGGMRQKLGLCCALIHEPDLLVLDEPTTGVDPLSRRQFWALIDAMRAARPQMSLLVATAYMAEAERFDRLIAMSGGRILAAGTPAELRRGRASLEQGFAALRPAADAAPAATTARPRPSGDGPPAILAQDLTCRFGDFTAVDRVSFRIARGEIFGFLGSNGCGKTTTMKMLTGLLPASAGTALLFGQPVDPRDLQLRTRVGYMSQSFSLYTELTVRQNLELHARLFQLPAGERRTRVAELIRSFELTAHAEANAAALPLGIRQRLSLAVALVHDPELLILDEPTSGVDPLARDRFWDLLLDLARNRGVTIFVSTHYMDEAERCDRVALMQAGRVLATGTPGELSAARGAASLEQAFIAELEAAGLETADRDATLPLGTTVSRRTAGRGFSWRRLLAYARREALELSRDPIRLGFALIGTAFLMLVFGYGITTDVERLTFAVMDRDQTQQSRAYLNGFRGSRYFVERPAIAGYAELDRRLQSGELGLALEIPAGFGRRVERRDAAEVGAWIDGAMPFRAETMRGYLLGVHAQYLAALEPRPAAARIETRFRYNQDFRSVYAMVPGTLALLLALIPAVLMALAVVREKELGTVVNLYVTPVTRLEFILGKQLPYVALGMLSFLSLAAMAVWLFAVPLKGSFAMLAMSALVYVAVTTGYGLAISSFASTQLAALFGTAILTILPAMQFSGLLTPVAALSGLPALMGQLFPMSWFLPISVGTFTKGLGFGELAGKLAGLALFAPVLTLFSLALLRKQER